MIGEVVSHYRITRLLGAGGMGVVYEARDTVLDRPVALKFLPPGALADPDTRVRFIHEAQAASALDHPNVCTVYEIGEAPDGSLFLAMAYYEGETLTARIARGPLAVDDAVDIAGQVAAGLAKAHEHGIIHRDIKPDNIFLTADGLVKILDFGLAKLSGRSLLTREGATPGTVAYMSPEQAGGVGIDHRTDLWSLGVVLSEMLTGRRPFRAEYEQAVIYAILNEEPPSPSELRPGLPPVLDRIVAICLAKDPERRWGSSGELGDALRGAAPARVRHRLRLAAVAVAAVALAAAAVLWFGRADDVHTTELRVAVMPLANHAHKAHDAAVAGLGTVVYRMLDEAARAHPSMWVARDDLVAYAAPTSDAQARTAFGVNRIVTGDLQRYGGGLVLRLVLRDAASLEPLREAIVPFAPPSAALADSLPGAILDLVRLGRARVTAWRLACPLRARPSSPTWKGSACWRRTTGPGRRRGSTASRRPHRRGAGAGAPWVRPRRANTRPPARRRRGCGRRRAWSGRWPWRRTAGAPASSWASCGGPRATPPGPWPRSVRPTRWTRAIPWSAAGCRGSTPTSSGWPRRRRSWTRRSRGGPTRPIRRASWPASTTGRGSRRPAGPSWTGCWPWRRTTTTP